MDKDETRRQRFVEALNEKQTHYRLYKSRHGWLVMGITTIALAAGLALTPQVVKADEQAVADPGVTESVDSSETDNTSSDPVSDPVATDETPAVDSNATDSAATSGDAEPVTDPAPAVDNSTTDSVPAGGTEIAASDPADTPAPSVSEPVTPPATPNDSRVTNPPTPEQIPVPAPLPAPPSTDTTSSQANTSDTTTDSSSASTVNDTSAPASSDAISVAPAADSARAVQNPAVTNAMVQLSDVSDPVPLALPGVTVPQTLIPAVTTPDSAVITEQVQQDDLLLNDHWRETRLTPDGQFRLAALFNTGSTVPEPVNTDTINAWLNNPMVPDYSVSVSNMRLVNNHWETTALSVISVNVPDQVLLNNTGIPFNYSPAADSAITIAFHEQNDSTFGAAETTLLNKTSVPNSVEIQISGNGPITTDMSLAGSLGINIRNQYWLVADKQYSFIPYVSLGLVTAPVSYQLVPTIDTHDRGATTLSGTGTEVGNTITVYSQDSSKTVTTAVDASGNWTINRTAAGFGADERLYVIESNNLGDKPGAVSDQEWAYNVETIYYVDVDHNPLGQATQQVLWTNISTIAFDANGKLIFTTHWTPVDEPIFPAYTLPDLPEYPDLYPRPRVLPAERSQGPGADINQIVPYLNKWLIIKPGDTIPSDYSSVTIDSLTDEVDRTVSFVTNTGEELQPPVDETLTFTRTAVLNVETKQLDHYTDWEPTTSDTFAQMDAPVIDGYYALTQKLDAYTIDDSKLGTSNQDITATFVYYPRDVQVTSDSPKAPGDPIDPANPDGPKYPTGVTTDNLNWSTSWRVMFTPYNVPTYNVFPPKQQTENYTRDATIHFDQNGVVTGIEYSDWQLNGPAFVPVVPSRLFMRYITNETLVEPPQVTPPADASGSGQTQVDYVKYFTNLVIVQPPTTPDGSLTVNPGDHTVPGEELSPQYPDSMDAADFVKTITRVIKFESIDGQVLQPNETQTVSFKRSISYNYIPSYTSPGIIYGLWTPYSTSEFAEFTNPTIDGYFTYTPTVAALPTTVNDPDVEKVVYYYPDTVKVSGSDPKSEGDLIDPTQPNGPKYPAGVDTDSLTLNVPVVIHYVEGVDLNNPLLDPTTQQVTFTRDATIKFAPDGTPTITYDAYQPDSQTSAGLATIPEVPGWVATVTDLPGIEVKPDSGKLDQYVKYYRAVVVAQPPADPDGEITITPGANTEPDPDSPKYPAVINKSEFVNNVTRTIEYVDSKTGDTLSSSVIQALSFKRTVGYNYTDDVLNPVVFYGPWEPYTTSQFEAVASPTIDGYFTLTKQVDALDVQGDTQPNSVIVLYFADTVNVPSTDPKAPDDLIDEMYPDGPKYPAGVDQNDLNDIVNVTIHFVDARDQSIELQPAVTQAVNFARDATVHFDQAGNATVTYTDWKPASDQNDGLATLPAIDGYVATQTKLDGLTVKAQAADGDQYVLYYPVKVTVEAPTTPDGELTVKPGDPTVPGDDQAPKYPADLKAEDLVSEVQRIVHYTDEAGVPVIKDAVQTIFFKRSVTYDYTDPANPIPTFGAWEPYTDGSFEAVPSPVLTDWFTATPVVPATQATAEAAPIVETVIYSQRFVTVQPDGPYLGETSKDLMNEAVTQTIHYLKPDGSYAIQDRITTLEFTRTATVNAETGEVIAWGAWTPTTTDTFVELVSPTFPDLFTDTKVIEATTVKAEDGDIEETVQYDPLFVTVPPDGPYIGETSKELLNTETTLTIHYVDKDGNQVAEDHTAVLAFTRTATVNVETEKVESYSAWQPVTTDSFAAVDSPVLPDLFTVDKTVGPTKVTDPEKPIEETVVYNDLYLVVEPDGPYVGGTSQEQQNETVTQTIHYVKADGSEAAPDHVATLAFTRTAIINVETDTVDHFGEWQPVTTDTFDEVVSPDVTDQYTITKKIDAVQVQAEDIDPEETVHYNDLYVVVQPDGPDYPGDTSKEDLNESVTQTIHYVDENGVTVSPDVSKTLTFTRTATINAETGAIVSHTDWTPVTTDTFEAVTSPSIDDLYTTQKTIDAVTVQADAVDINEDVVYHQLIVTVGPDGPYVGNTSKELLNQEVVQTIHYIDEAGQTVADDSVKSLAFTRTVKVNAETGKIVDEGTWIPTTTDTFDAVKSPDVANMFTTQKTVDPVQVTALQDDVTETVTYKDLYVTVKPDGPYVGDATKEALNQQVNQTIHYVDSKGDTVFEDHTATLDFTRTVIVNAETGKITDEGTWTPTTTDTFGEVISPTSTSLFTVDKKIDATQVTADHVDIDLTVEYKPLFVVVQPEGPDYPGDTSKEDLNVSVTQTIHYVDENGATVSPDVTKTLAFTRAATINDETGEIVSHTEWQPVTTDTFDAVTSPTFDDMFTKQKTIDAVTVKADAVDIVENVVYQQKIVTVGPDGPFVGNTSKELLNQEVVQTIHYIDEAGQTVADDSVKSLAFTRTVKVNAETGKIVDEGTWIPTTTDTFDAVKSPDVANMFTTQKTVDPVQVTALQDDVTETVTYKDLFVTVKPDGPYVGDATKEALNQQVNQTIHYVDAQGNTVAPDHTDTLLFTRTVIVNAETGAITDQGTWTPTTTDNFGEVVSPTLPNLYTTEKKIDAVQVKAEDGDLENTVTYNDLYLTLQPEGPDYPGDSAYDQLNESVTQTIHYVKADGSEAAPDSVKTLTFTRTAKFNVETQKVESYSDWVAVDGDIFAEVKSPDVKDQFTDIKSIPETKVTAKTADIQETVQYNDLYQVVQPEGPDYPGDTTEDLLNKTITSTIHYLKADGSVAAKDDVQTLAFKRTATINVETGKVESLGDWQAVDGDTFKDVESPILADEFTTDKIVKGQQVTADSKDPETTVQYQTKFVIVQPEGPDYPGDSSQDVLNKTITQTIHYVDGDGKTVAKDNVATLDFIRTAKVDLETGEVVDWGDWQPKTTDTFVEVVSPNVTDLTPDKKQIVATEVTGKSEDITETVTYSSLYATVEPDGPFIGQTSADKLNHTVKQTIHYVLPDGSEAAPDSVKTLAFKRTAQVNVETGEILSYGDWQAVTTDTFDAVVSPTLTDLFTKTKQIDATTVDGDTADIVETVEYQELYIIVKPGDDYQNDPALGDTLADQLITDTIRTIKYVDEAGNEVAQEYSIRLTFQRTAKVNVETNTVEEYTPWDPLNDVFPEVTSPDVDNMFTEQKTLPAIPIEPGAKDIPETVTYKDLYITVNPEDPTYPDGVTKDDLNHSVTQTIHYVKADGTEAAPDHVVTLDFTRTAKYNVETGKVESYSDWAAVNGDTFAAVLSPEVTDQFPKIKQIDAKTVKATDGDITETVQYNELYAVVQPDGPYTGEATKEALNEAVTATIHYLKADGTQAAQDDVQTLAFKRTATVNVETGKVETFGDWQPVTTDTFDDVVSPILTDEFTTDKTVTGKKVAADTADFETNVQYQAKFAIVQPEGPDYPGESSQDVLNKTVTQTIHYVDVNGDTVAKDNVATLDFTRTAQVDLETGKIVEFGKWQPKTTDTFAEVFSPTVEKLTPDHKQIDSVKVSIDDPQDVETTVTYSDLYVTVQPEGPNYVGEASVDKLNHTVTQTIHYVKADGSEAAPDSVKTLAFKRTAQVNVETGEILSFGDWEAVTTDSFDAVKSPDVPDQFTATKQIDAVKVDGDSKDIVETVMYQDLYTTVNPDGPYTGDATKDYLNQSVTNTIHYVDVNGDTVAKDATQTLAFTRTATVNAETGKVVNTTDWKPVTTDVFDDVTSPIVDNLFTNDKQIKGAQVKAEDADLDTTVTYKNLYVTVNPDDSDYPDGVTKDELNQSVTQTIHYVKADGSAAAPDHVVTLAFTRTGQYNLETGKVDKYSDWIAVDGDTFAKLVSPDVPDQFTTTKQIDAVKVTAETADIEETVAYSDLIVTVKPDGPFIGDTSKELLNQSVTRTIHYVDAEGHTVSPDATKTLAFTRTATVNAETGEVISKSDWKPVTTDTFEAVTNPVLDDLFTTTKQIDAAKVDAEHTDIVENVVYNKLFITVSPDGPYTGDATKDYLNQSVTNTIYYVDADGKTVSEDASQTLFFTRTATVNVETGKIVDHTDWKPATTDTFADKTSPAIENLFTEDKVVKGAQVKAEDADHETTVVYKDLYVTVKPEGPDYPAGTSKEDLNQAVTQTIHYVNENGDTVSPDVTKTLNFTRTATINVETGVVSHTDWQATTTDTFDKVVSPEIVDLFTKQKAIDTVTVKAEAEDIIETVVYQQLIVTVGPDGPYVGKTEKELLNQSVTQTIHYVDESGNTVSPDVTKTLTFTRTATVNVETGEVISKSDWKPVTTDTFEAVKNPDVNDMYTTDDPIEAVQVAAEDADLEVTITYKDLYLIVKPEGPDYPDGISKEDLNQEVTQTIHYVDEEGKPVAPDHQITLKFTRTAKVNVLTGVVTYSDWQAVTTDTFAAVPNLILKGYKTNSKEVDLQTVTADSPDLSTTVIYKAITAPTPKPEPEPKPQPEPQPTPDQGGQPEQDTPAPNTNTQQIGPAVITPASAGTTNDQMPTTSDAQNTKLSLIGLILASFATVGAWFTSRKHKKGARH